MMAKAFTRVTTILNTISDQGGIPIWQQRKLVQGLVARSDLWLLASAAVSAGDDRKISSVAKEAIEVARASEGANLGSAVHSFFEEVVRRGRKDVVIPAPWGEYVDRIFSALEDAGVEVLECERVVYIPELDAVGTMDHRLRLPDGREIVGDLKTGRLDYLFKPSLSGQLAAYSHGTRVLNEEPSHDGLGRYLVPDPGTKAWEDLATLDQELGLVTHLDKDTGLVSLHFIDLIKGWQYAQMAREIYDLRKLEIGHASIAPAPGSLVSSGGRKRRSSGTSVQKETVDPVQALRAEIKRCLATEGYEQALRMRWPIDIPTLASDHQHTPEELEKIRIAVRDAASDMEVPF